MTLFGILRLFKSLKHLGTQRQTPETFEHRLKSKIEKTLKIGFFDPQNGSKLGTF